MKLEEKIKTLVLNDLAETAFASAFLANWIVCCVATAFLLRMVGEDLADGNNAQISENNFRRYFRKHLLRSKTALVGVPEALGI